MHCKQKRSNVRLEIDTLLVGQVRIKEFSRPVQVPGGGGVLVAAFSNACVLFDVYITYRPSLQKIHFYDPKLALAIS